jgi:hypothetical protein
MAPSTGGFELANIARRRRGGAARKPDARRDKTMCAHVAWALLVHSVLIILLVGHRLHLGSGVLLGQMIIVAMIALFVLVARDFDCRWRRAMTKGELSAETERVVRRYRRDLGLLWLLALGLPFFWLLLL